MAERRLAWPLRKDDTQNREALNSMDEIKAGHHDSLRAMLAKLPPSESLLEHTEVVPKMMTEVDPDWASRPYLNGLYPLHIACKRGYVKTTRYLIDKCHCDVNVTDEKNGLSPLHLACAAGHAYLAYILVKQYHADVNLRDIAWRTPLEWAAIQGHLIVVKVLVQNCNANPTLRDTHGDTPSEVAKISGHHDISLFLEGCHFNSTASQDCPQLTFLSVDELVTIPARGEEMEDKIILQLNFVDQSPTPQCQACQIQLHSIEEGTKEPLNSSKIQTSALAVRLVFALTPRCGRSLLSGKDCLSCSQVCTTWRRQLSADDSIWIPHIKEVICKAVRNTMEYMDKNIPQERKKEWKNATTFGMSEVDALKTWAATPPEKFCGNSKVKYLWVLRKKGRVPLPETSVPTYNPLIHNKWWSLKDVARCWWCYIWHYQWLGFFIKQSIIMKDSYDRKVLASVRNSLGVVGVLVTLLLFGKCLSVPGKGTDDCALWPPDHNYFGVSVLFSVFSSFILYAFSLGSKKNMWYWFPISILIVGTIPFPSEWICLFRSITHPNPIFMAVASAVMLTSTFLFSKYTLKEPYNRNSLGLGIFVTIIGLVIWYDRFVMVLRVGSTAQQILRRNYPTYDLTWGRHKMAMAAFVFLLVAYLVLFLEDAGTYMHTIKSNGNIYNIRVVDTIGTEEYDRLRPLSYPNADVFLVCFSVGNRFSWASVDQQWYPEECLIT
ncbi:hypothetical protein Pelo_9143 [Pelomyxa schiedti]|nr:hypothetical protein Pelo_9143 [Pelomyxa schiedti]